MTIHLLVNQYLTLLHHLHQMLLQVIVVVLQEEAKLFAQ